MRKLNKAQDRQRLAALYDLNILDTKPEPSYDRLTRLCTQAFDVPIAAISLVDENRQWFKSIKGLKAKETERSCAICDYTIRHGGPLVIEETTKDIRTKNNPLVTGKPGIRFYAGCPLVLTNGERVGALCIIDRRPRSLGPHQIVTLSRLADLVVRKMELRAALDRLFWDISDRFELADCA